MYNLVSLQTFSLCSHFLYWRNNWVQWWQSVDYRDDDDGDNELQQRGGESAEKYDEEAEHFDVAQIRRSTDGHRERLQTAFPECTAVDCYTNTHAQHCTAGLRAWSHRPTQLNWRRALWSLSSMASWVTMNRDRDRGVITLKRGLWKRGNEKRRTGKHGNIMYMDNET